jgi:hypothetical protein
MPILRIVKKSVGLSENQSLSSSVAAVFVTSINTEQDDRKPVKEPILRHRSHVDTPLGDMGNGIGVIRNPGMRDVKLNGNAGFSPRSKIFAEDYFWQSV